MAHPPVRTWLITGFLGAGKTTFIKSRLNTDRGKTAVLVNEESDCDDTAPATH